MRSTTRSITCNTGWVIPAGETDARTICQRHEEKRAWRLEQVIHLGISDHSDDVHYVTGNAHVLLSILI
jgi:hypothetical protein